MSLVGTWLSKGWVTGHLAAGAQPRLPVAGQANWLAIPGTLGSSSHCVDAPVTFSTIKDRGFQTLLPVTHGRTCILPSDPVSL